MSGEEIEIECTPDGMKVDMKNFTGDTCTVELEKMFQDLEKLGIKATITNQQKKAEYHASRMRTGQQRSRI
jgi:hypothetical protein